MRRSAFERAELLCETRDINNPLLAARGSNESQQFLVPGLEKPRTEPVGPNAVGVPSATVTMLTDPKLKDADDVFIIDDDDDDDELVEPGALPQENGTKFGDSGAVVSEPTAQPSSTKQTPPSSTLAFEEIDDDETSMESSMNGKPPTTVVVMSSSSSSGSDGSKGVGGSVKEWDSMSINKGWAQLEKNLELKDQIEIHTRGRYFFQPDEADQGAAGEFNMQELTRDSLHLKSRLSRSYCYCCGSSEHQSIECCLSTAIELCGYCDSPNHSVSECPDRNLRCAVCQRLGHDGDSTGKCPWRWIASAIDKTSAVPVQPVRCTVCSGTGHYFCGPLLEKRHPQCTSCAASTHQSIDCPFPARFRGKSVFGDLKPQVHHVTNMRSSGIVVSSWTDPSLPIGYRTTSSWHPSGSATTAEHQQLLTDPYADRVRNVRSDPRDIHEYWDRYESMRCEKLNKLKDVDNSTEEIFRTRTVTKLPEVKPPEPIKPAQPTNDAPASIPLPRRPPPNLPDGPRALKQSESESVESGGKPSSGPSVSPPNLNGGSSQQRNGTLSKGIDFLMSVSGANEVEKWSELATAATPQSSGMEGVTSHSLVQLPGESESAQQTKLSKKQRQKLRRKLKKNEEIKNNEIPPPPAVPPPPPVAASSASPPVTTSRSIKITSPVRTILEEKESDVTSERAAASSSSSGGGARHHYSGSSVSSDKDDGNHHKRRKTEATRHETVTLKADASSEDGECKSVQQPSSPVAGTIVQERISEPGVPSSSSSWDYKDTQTTVSCVNWENRYQTSSTSTSTSFCRIVKNTQPPPNRIVRDDSQSGRMHLPGCRTPSSSTSSSVSSSSSSCGEGITSVRKRQRSWSSVCVAESDSGSDVDFDKLPKSKKAFLQKIGKMGLNNLSQIRKRRRASRLVKRDL